jgi:hypothetical protein
MGKSSFTDFDDLLEHCQSGVESGRLTAEAALIGTSARFPAVEKKP